MNLQDRAVFYQKLLTGVKSGLTLQQVIDARLLPAALADRSTQLKKLMDKGTSISESFRKAGLVSDWEARLIQIGETSGRLETVCSRLSDFYACKVLQLGHIKRKLVAPLATVLVAITVLPLPAVFGGLLSPAAYLARVAAGIGVMVFLYRMLLIRPFTGATLGAFNPNLVRSLGFVGNTHFLRLMFEVSYLDLLTLCLDSGMDAVQSLKLLQENLRQKKISREHAFAISKVDKGGCSLREALGGQGILKNPMVLSFLAMSETSGTLHSDMREFIERQRREVDSTMDYWIRNISVLVYIGSVIYAAMKIVPLFMQTILP